MKYGIKFKLVVALGLLMTMLLLVGITGMKGMRDANKTAGKVFNEGVRAIQLAGIIHSRLSDNYAQYLAALQHNPDSPFAYLHDHPLTEHLNAMSDNIEVITRATEELGKIEFSDKEIKIQLDKFSQARQKFGAEGLLPAKSALQAEMYDEAADFLPSVIRPYYVELNIETEALQNTIQAYVGDIKKDTDERYSKLVAIESILILTGFSIIAVVSWMMMRAVQTLNTLKSAALSISANDLRVQVVEVKSQDEIGELATAIAMMKNNLTQQVSEISSMCQQIRQSVSTLSSVSDHASQGVQKTHRETQQMATAIHEMTATVHEVSRNTAASANAASQADENVQNGRHVVQQTIASIKKLADEVHKGSDAISLLNSNSNDIGTVLDVIRGIAEQTNLLALNAAIEAARAGEQGRGFAVVADEVRTLAQRTQASTQEIRQMIEKLQQGTQDAVRVMEEGRKQAEASVNQANQAGRSLDNIHAAVATIHDMSTQIASAVEEQGAVAEEINRNILNVSQVAEQSAEDVVKTVDASSHLAQMAERLQTTVSRFKLA